MLAGIGLGMGVVIVLWAIDRRMLIEAFYAEHLRYRAWRMVAAGRKR